MVYLSIYTSIIYTIYVFSFRQQYTDTRNTLNDIYNTVNEQFSDPGPVKPTSSPRITTEKSVSNSRDLSNLSYINQLYKVCTYIRYIYQLYDKV